MITWASTLSRRTQKPPAHLAAYLKGVEEYLPTLSDALGIQEVGSFAKDIWKEVIASTGPLIMVELKLARWREAYDQAIFYLGMAEGSCVVLCEDASHSVDSSPFRKAGIGLYVARAGTFDRVLDPKLSGHAHDPRPVFQKLRALIDVSSEAQSKWGILQREVAS